VQARLVRITLVVGVLMTVYEALKEWFAPEISKWESHAITILVTCGLAAIAAFLVYRQEQVAAEELRRREEDLRILLESIGDAVIATDREGRVSRLNPVAQKLTGYSEEEALGRSIDEVFDIYNAETQERVASPVERVVQSGLVVGLANHTELHRRDGVRFAIADSGAPIFDANGKVVGVVIVFRDVTDEYRLRGQALQAEKLDSLGMLAGGIAHDFNNLLAGISGAAELIGMDLSPNDTEARAQLAVVLSATAHAKDLTNRLLAFARKQTIVSKPIDAHQAVRDTIALLERSIDKRVRIVTELAAERSVVSGDLGQLSSVFMNLGINASRAMPNGGQLTFTTSVVELDQEHCADSAFHLEPGPYLCVEVRDTGWGIAAEHLGKIFDPFYIVEEQVGTGLGLAAVYGSVRQHGGSVTVYSEVAKGTVFRVRLRLVDGKQEVRPPVQVQTGAARILLIEDDATIRRVASLFLTRIGHKVTTSNNGREGLEAYLSREQAFDLVILDMVMPEMNGADCFRALRERDPDVKVLLCSGFTGGADVQELIHEGARGFVGKPYELAELSRAVGRALDGAAAPDAAQA
jgi:two-component system, cell cycle sensor histidine kinase and response regulator CckA